MRPTNSSTGDAVEPERRAPCARRRGRRARRRRGRRRAARARCGRARRRRAHELLGLGGARRGDGVGAADHLGLGLDAALGLGVAGLGLDPGQRVEGRHQRQVELVLEPVAGDARQPVVGVDRVDVAVGRRVGEHAVGELVDDLGQLLLGQRRRDRRRRGRPGSRARPRPRRAGRRPSGGRTPCSATPAWASDDTSSRT